MKKQWLEIAGGLLVLAAACGAPSHSAPDGDGSTDEDPTLVSLALSPGALSPTFVPLQTSYTASEPFFVDIVTLVPTAKSAKATIAVSGQPVLSGFSQAISLSVGLNPITVEVTTPAGKMKRYDVIVARNAVSIEYLKASNTGMKDNFGYSVSLSGDTLAIGAPYESSDATGVDGHQTNDAAPSSGAVYVFTRVGSTWIEQAYLKASNTHSYDSFGCSVSLEGDTLAVGALYESSNASGVVDGSHASSGAVYVFSRSGGTTWTQQAYLKAKNPGQGDSFGSSVSLSGDTLAIGAINESSSNATGSGAVYIFTRSKDAEWTQQDYLKARSPGQNDHFGLSVSLSADTLAVGVPSESSNASGVVDHTHDASGAVYLFTRSSGGPWSQQAYLKTSNPGQDDRFGYSVSLSGDTLAVGAYGEASNASGARDAAYANSGAVYVFTRSSGALWSQQAYLKAFNTGQGDFFGKSVSLSGDALVVGAYGEDSKATGVNGDQGNDDAMAAGAAYLFRRSGSTWSQRAYLKASNTEMGDAFGWSVCISGDRIAVGAINESSNGVGDYQADNSAPTSGAVYVY